MAFPLTFPSSFLPSSQPPKRHRQIHILAQSHICQGPFPKHYFPFLITSTQRVGLAGFTRPLMLLFRLQGSPSGVLYFHSQQLFWAFFTFPLLASEKIRHFAHLTCQDMAWAAEEALVETSCAARAGTSDLLLAELLETAAD